MSDNPPPTGLDEHDFERIEDAVMETARGRWFLREYARRMRTGETARLLDAMHRIERVLTGQPAAALVGPLEMEGHIDAVEARGVRLGQVAAMLREQGYDGGLCAMLDREARAITAIVADMRAPSQAPPVEPAMEDILPPERPAALDEPQPELDERGAPITIEGTAVDVEPPAEAPGAEVVHLDFSGLAAIDDLPFEKKLSLFG